jgi:hypothetical protein
MGWRREVLKEGNFQKLSGLLQESGNSASYTHGVHVGFSSGLHHDSTKPSLANHTTIEHRLERRNRCILSLRVWSIEHFSALEPPIE